MSTKWGLVVAAVLFVVWVIVMVHAFKTTREGEDHGE